VEEEKTTHTGGVIVEYSKALRTETSNGDGEHMQRDMIGC
jgi:hypothetical protein